MVYYFNRYYDSGVNMKISTMHELILSKTTICFYVEYMQYTTKF